jgi:hypothetical protein
VSLAASASGAVATTSHATSATVTIHAHGQAAGPLPFEARATGFDPDGQQDHEARQRDQPERHDPARGEKSDQREEQLRHAQEQHGLARGPAERDEAVEHVVVAVLEQRPAAAGAVQHDEAGVEQEDREEDQWRRQLPPGRVDRLHRERADRQGEPDAEPAAPTDEERCRAHVEREEGEAGGDEPHQHGREAVLVRERGHAEEAGAGAERSAGGEAVGVAEPVDRLHHCADQEERAEHVEDAHPCGSDARAGGDGHHGAHDHQQRGEPLDARCPLDGRAGDRHDERADGDEHREVAERRRERETDERSERDERPGASPLAPPCAAPTLPSCVRREEQHGERGDDARQQPPVDGRERRHHGGQHRVIVSGCPHRFPRATCPRAGP